VSIYECCTKESTQSDEPFSPLKLLQAYADVDSDENFYTCAWTSDDVTGLPLLAAAGSRGLIRIINPSTATCVKVLFSHSLNILASVVVRCSKMRADICGKQVARCIIHELGMIKKLSIELLLFFCLHPLNYVARFSFIMAMHHAC